MRKELLTVRDDVFVVHDFFTSAECEHFIAQSESVGFGDAPINTFAGPQINKRMRNNERVTIDDHTLAATLWERLAPLIPEKRGSWRACGLNE